MEASQARRRYKHGGGGVRGGEGEEGEGGEGGGPRKGRADKHPGAGLPKGQALLLLVHPRGQAA
eukprot:scaffold10315_cov49-Phaeocystis_antarctica.AAC.2